MYSNNVGRWPEILSGLLNNVGRWPENIVWIIRHDGRAWGWPMMAGSVRSWSKMLVSDQWFDITIYIKTVGESGPISDKFYCNISKYNISFQIYK